MFTNKFLVVISILFALNFNIQSTGLGMTPRLHSVLKDYGFVCSEPPNVPLVIGNFKTICVVQEKK